MTFKRMTKSTNSTRNYFKFKQRILTEVGHRRRSYLYKRFKYAQFLTKLAERTLTSGKKYITSEQYEKCRLPSLWDKEVLAEGTKSKYVVPDTILADESALTNFEAFKKNIKTLLKEEWEEQVNY